MENTDILKSILSIGFCLLIFLDNTKATQAETTIKIILSTIPPLVMQEEGRNSGVLWDVAHEIESRLEKTGTPLPKLEVQTLILPWNRAYDRLHKSANIIMLQMARTAAREPQFHWISEIGELSFAFITTTKPAVNSLPEALTKKSVAVYRGSRLENFLRSKNFGVNLRPTNDSKTSARLLVAGRVETWYASVQEALWLHKQGLLKAKPIIGTPIFSTSIWAVASLDTETETIERINTILQTMKKDGSLTEIHSRYGLEQHK